LFDGKFTVNSISASIDWRSARMFRTHAADDATVLSIRNVSVARHATSDRRACDLRTWEARDEHAARVLGDEFSVDFVPPSTTTFIGCGP
jgi:hypothetical protein